MATIDLKIVADSTQAVQEINKVTETTKSMQRSVQEGEKRQKGLIEDVTEAIKKLETARSKSMSMEGIEKYNKKLIEAKQTLKEYETAGVQSNQKIEKSGNSLLKGIGKWALGFATVATAVKIFKGIVASTETTAHKFEVVIESARSGLGYFFKTIASGDWSNFSDGLENAIKGAKRFVEESERIANLSNEQLIKSAQLDKEISDLRADTWNRDDTNNENRLEKLDLIIAKQKEKYDAEAVLLRRSYENNLEKAASDSGLSAAMIENFVKEYSSLEDLITIGEKYNDITKAMRQPGMVGEYIAKLDEERKALGENAKEAANYVVQVGKITKETRASLSSYLADAIHREAQFNATDRRDKMQKAALEEEIRKKKEDADKEANDKRLKLQEEYQKAAEKLLKDFEKAQLEAFSGKERIIAERNLNLALLDEQRKFMEARGKLTDEQTEQFKALYNNIWNEAELALVEFDIAEIEERQKTADKIEKTAKDNAANLLDIQRETQELALELLGDNEEAKLALQIKFIEENRAEISRRIMNREGSEAELNELTALYTQFGIKLNILRKKQTEGDNKFDLGKLLGVTPDELDKIKENIGIVIENITGMLDDMYAKRVDDAQRTRELLDTQIDDTQNALDAEIELAEIGFANNVDLKRKELEELKKAREKAVKDEEKALKAQRAMDAAMQASSLLTATAQIIAGLTKNTPLIGLVLSVAAIAAMWTMFAAARVQAAKATKLSEGAVGNDVGVIEGRSHQQGGERFLDHVEVEKGEMWGVLSRSAAAKHGKEFSQIVTSFNKDNLVVERMDTPNNYINVDVNQTNSRLDKVENQLIKLNRHFAGQKEVHETADMRIEKIGNKTRIIRK